MSTAEYVRAYEAANNSARNIGCAGFWQPLNTEPAAAYAGLDSVEHGDFDLLADDAPAEIRSEADAPAELPRENAPMAEPVPMPDPVPADPADLARELVARVRAAAAAPARLPPAAMPCPADPAPTHPATVPAESGVINALGECTPHDAFPTAPPADAFPADPESAQILAHAAEWIGRVYANLATDPMPRAGCMLAAKSERARSAAIASRDGVNLYSRAAAAVADELQARADALPIPPAPTLDHPDFDGYGGAWREIETGLAEPDEYRARVIEAMEAALAAGLSYNSETWPRASAYMAAKWGYPDVRESADGGADGVARFFGSHCYMARGVIRARESRRVQAESRDALRLTVGTVLGALIFNDFKLTQRVAVVAVSDDGDRVTLTGKRGAYTVRVECPPVAVREAIERAHEKGKRRDSFAEFCAGRPAAVEEPVVSAGTPYPEILNLPQEAPIPADVADEQAADDAAMADDLGERFDADSMADLQAAMATARVLADAMGAAAPARVILAESDRLRAAARDAPAAIARRWLLAAHMLQVLADSRAAVNPSQPPAEPCRHTAGHHVPAHQPDDHRPHAGGGLPRDAGRHGDGSRGPARGGMLGAGGPGQHVGGRCRPAAGHGRRGSRDPALTLHAAVAADLHQVAAAMRQAPHDHAEWLRRPAGEWRSFGVRGAAALVGVSGASLRRSMAAMTTGQQLAAPGLAGRGPPCYAFPSLGPYLAFPTERAPPRNPTETMP